MKQLLDALRVRRSQGTQFIRDVQTALPAGFRGLPQLASQPCVDGCQACVESCHTAAISLEPLRLDLGRCTFCGRCEEVCPAKRIQFSAEPKMSATERTSLQLEAERPGPAVQTNRSIAKVFGRSLKLRQVSAGGCNACELELNAISNVNFDAQRFGIEWVASPRHADALVLSGPLTKNMREAVQLAWDAMPDPRFLVVVGACGISGAPYEHSTSIDRAFLEQVPPVLYVPGCPPHPLTFVNALLDFLGRTKVRGA